MGYSRSRAMTPNRISLLFFTLLSCVGCGFPQVVTSSLDVVKEAKLPKDVYDVVAVGGPNAAIQCDAEQNIWIPGVRGYSDAVSSLVRFNPGRASLRINIDGDPRFKNGSIESFSPLQNGGLLALVRTVAEYNKIDGRPTTPKRYADTFAVAFDASGAISNATQLKVPLLDEKLTALAQLKNGWLTAGYTDDSATVEVHVHLFDPAGGLTTEVQLPESRNKASRTGHAEFAEVFRPTILRTGDGALLVFRGFTDQSVYSFSVTGQLLGTTKLHPGGIDFWAPRLVGDSLFVHADVSPEKLGMSGSIPVVRLRSAFPVFDLKTGGITEVMTWMDYGSVGCFDGTHLLLLKQANGDSDDSTWRILTLERAPVKTHGPKT